MHSRSRAQKRLKTSTNQPIKQDQLYQPNKYKKTNKIPSKHLKSCSKDISRATFIEVTPKKHGKASKIREVSHKNSIKAKHLSSCINYQFNERNKQTTPVTKRKGSDVGKINKKIKVKTKQFHVLCRCLNQYAKQERKSGKDPNPQILKLIQAFNSSQIGSLSKELQNLIECMLEYIERMVADSKQQEKQEFGGTQISKQKIAYSKNLADEDLVFDTQVKKGTVIMLGSTGKKLEYEDRTNGHCHDDANSDDSGQIKRQIYEQLDQRERELANLQQASQKICGKVMTKSEERLYLQKIIVQQQKALIQLQNSGNLSEEEEASSQDNMH